jgi:hypothetical protein
MTDRELLEAAARAAGVALDYRRGSDSYYYDDTDTGREEWHPLDSDGQALRLAVKFDILSDPRFYHERDVLIFTKNMPKLAATRYAIVQCVARIGGQP